MNRSYGTQYSVHHFNNGLKSVATIWIVPMELNIAFIIEQRIKIPLLRHSPEKTGRKDPGLRSGAENLVCVDPRGMGSAAPHPLSGECERFSDLSDLGGKTDLAERAIKTLRPGRIP